MISSIPDHRLDTDIWTFIAAQRPAHSNDNSATSACHNNVTRATDSKTVKLPIIGFNVATNHNYDANVGGPLKGPLNDTSKKRRFYSIKKRLFRRSCRPSPRSRRARASFLCSIRLQRVPPPPYTHHVATDMVEEFTPFCAVALSNGALPTPSRPF